MSKREVIEKVREKIMFLWEKYKTVVLVILGIIGVIILPFITELIIRYGEYRPDSFENDVWFSFMGSYLGAVVTLVVMFITFKKTDKENRRLIERQKKQHEIDMQNQKLANIIHVLLLDGYYFLNLESVSENLDRFMGDLNYVQFDTLKFKYITHKDEKLMTELLELQKEEVEILNEMKDSMPHVDSRKKAEEMKIFMLGIGLKLSNVANAKRETIKFMYDSYLEKVYKDYFD